MLKDNLVQLGLTENEAKTYIHLLQNYKAKASEIAKFLEVTHPAAKKILDSLISKDLITANEYGKTTFYFPENSEKIVKLVTKEQKKYLEILEKNKKLAEETNQLIQTSTAIGQDGATDIRFYKGKEGQNKVVHEIAHAEEKTVWEFYDSDLSVYSSMKNKAERKKMFEKNNIEFEVVYTSSHEDNNPIKTDNVKIDKKNVFTPTAEIVVYDDTVCFSFITDDRNVVTISNQQIANTIKTLIKNLKENIKK